MRIVIIGNGISGITAARCLRQRTNDDIIVISSESNYFFARPALMYVFMGHMKLEHTKPYEDWFWAKNRIQLLKKHVKKVDFLNKNLVFTDEAMLDYDKLIIACGSKVAKQGWKGEELKGVQGFYSLQDLETLESRAPHIRRAVVVGGGLIGIELCEMLRSRKIEVTFLIREKHYWGNVLPSEEASIVHNELQENGVDLCVEEEVAEILGNEQGHVEAVLTKSHQKIVCDFVGITTGVTPNIDFLKDSGIALGKGVLVNEYFETSFPDVYAIGDCAEFIIPFKDRKPIEQMWYSGKRHGEVVAKIITGERVAYKPGIWFNAAKFFSIEYQTYGNVPAFISETHDSILWQNDKKLIRLVFEKETRKLVGINLLGVRYKQEVCERWIKEEKSIDHVIKHLSEANFDAEFSKKYEPLLVEIYRHKFPANASELVPKKKKFLFF